MSHWLRRGRSVLAFLTLPSLLAACAICDPAAVPTRVPGSVRRADKDVLPVVRYSPAYPCEAEAQGIEGYVSIQFSILEDGKVGGAQVIESVPPGIFDSAALAAVQLWEYAPFLVDGTPTRRDGVKTKLAFKLER